MIKHVLVVGSALNGGLRLFGLFDTENEAILWARTHASIYAGEEKSNPNGTPWEIAQVELIEDVP